MKCRQLARLVTLDRVVLQRRRAGTCFTSGKLFRTAVRNVCLIVFISIRIHSSCQDQHTGKELLFSLSSRCFFFFFSPNQRLLFLLVLQENAVIPLLDILHSLQCSAQIAVNIHEMRSYRCLFVSSVHQCDNVHLEPFYKYK